MSITLTKITPEQHASAFEWIKSVFHGEDWFVTPDPQECYRIIETWYEGGWPQFVADQGGRLTVGQRVDHHGYGQGVVTESEVDGMVAVHFDRQSQMYAQAHSILVRSYTVWAI
jgi:hypothetical protein